MAALILKPAPLSSTTGAKKTLIRGQEAQTRVGSKALLIITPMEVLKLVDIFKLQTSTAGKMKRVVLPASKVSHPKTKERSELIIPSLPPLSLRGYDRMLSRA